MVNVAPVSAPPRLLVMGCGSIGGIIAAHLVEQGHDVTVLTSNPLVYDAVNQHGFRVRGDGSPGTVRGRVVGELPQSTAPFDFVLLAMQPRQVEDAVRAALPALAPNGAMVCLQNGLCEERIAAIAGHDRTIGAIVAWGATMVEPGVYDRTSSGGFVLGRLQGAASASSTDAFAGRERLDELARILEAVGPTSITDNLAGARWSKLAIDCAISSLGTVGGDRLGALSRHPFVRRLALEIMTETVAVARANDVRLEKVPGTLDLDWIALTDAERDGAASPGLLAKHALLLSVGARYRRLRSSMLVAIERGRPPAADFLNGEVVTRGAAHGVPTPINAAIGDEVLAIARGDVRSGIDRLRSFFERTRALAAGPGNGPPISPVGHASLGDLPLEVARGPADEAIAPATVPAWTGAATPLPVETEGTSVPPEEP